MAGRPRHPKQEVEKAVTYAEAKGWRWRKQGHWGVLLCPCATQDGCRVGVNATPQNAGNQRGRFWRQLRNARTESAMKTFEFMIIASGIDPDQDDAFDRFYDAGLDDATVSFQRGRFIVDVSREASSIEEAIASAVENVKAAGATIERIEPDHLVNLSDIAERTGLTRAAVSLYSSGERAEGFPPPVARVTTAAPLYDWSDVAEWLYMRKRLERDAVIEALALKASNRILEATVPDFGRALKERLRAEEGRLQDA